MNRRKFIAGAGGIGAATIGGAALMGSVSADEQVETGWFGVPDTHYQDSQSGRLQSLTLEDIQILVEWKNFSYAATHFDYTLSATIGEETHKILSEDNIDISEAHFGDTDYEGARQHSAGSVELLDYFEPEDIETPYDHDGSEYTEDAELTHTVEFTLSVDVHDDGKNKVNGDVTGEGHIHLTNLGAEKAAGGSGEFSSEEQENYDPSEGDSDPEIETVYAPAEGVEIDGWQEGGPPGQGEITIHNQRDVDLNVVVGWVNPGGNVSQTRVYFVEAGGSTGPVGNSDGDKYEG